MYSRSFSDRSPSADIPAQYAGTALKREARGEKNQEEATHKKTIEERIEEEKERAEEKREEAVNAGLFNTPPRKEPPFCDTPPPPPPKRGEGGLFPSLKSLFGDSGIESEDLLLLAIALLLFGKNQENGLLPLSLLLLLLIK